MVDTIPDVLEKSLGIELLPFGVMLVDSDVTVHNFGNKEARHPAVYLRDTDPFLCVLKDQMAHHRPHSLPRRIWLPPPRDESSRKDRFPFPPSFSRTAKELPNWELLQRSPSPTFLLLQLLQVSPVDFKGLSRSPLLQGHAHNRYAQ